jgi:Spy/CpxP family protein refolding chaperone
MLQANHWKWAVVVSSLVGLGALGCEGDNKPAAGGPAASQTAAVTASASGSAMMNHKGHMKHKGGPFMSFKKALHSLELKDEQREKVKAVFEEVKTANMESMKAHKEFNAALAAQVKAGKIEKDKLKPQIEAAEKAHADSKEKTHASLGKLHALLTPEQRTQLADTMLKEKQNHPWGLAEMDKNESDESKKERREEMRKKRVERMKENLKLSDDQVKKVEALWNKDEKKFDKDKMKERMEKMKAKRTEMWEAFKTDKFDASKFTWGSKDAKDKDKKDKRMSRMSMQIEKAEKMLTILKKDQRDAYAATLERPMMGMGHGMHRGHGPMKGMKGMMKDKEPAGKP